MSRDDERKTQENLEKPASNTHASGCHRGATQHCLKIVYTASKQSEY